ncbi:hypothetical protein BGAL_0100g00080 [Botrytis galanthina]|uniref:Uncharacterized protein n=1 Tax=Botrytis galanthina TaxID=278940 RepID=A0A4S8RBJ7_9HELO|nr:hypothetical protein BGAL_0100g00080 [Botrytis galanthina]
MDSQISPPDWPKRPKLDYTNDDNRVAISLDFEIAGAPKSKVYHVSKLRLAYHSPRCTAPLSESFQLPLALQSNCPLVRKIFDEQDPRVVDSHNSHFQELAAPPDVDYGVFCHIVQYSFDTCTHLVSKTFLGGAMCHIQENNEWLREANLEPGAVCVQDANMATLGCFLVADEIDGGNAEDGLDESFDFNRDLLERRPIQVLPH